MPSTFRGPKPTRQYEVAYLHGVKEIPLVDVARMLGIRPATARRLWARTDRRVRLIYKAA